MNRSRKNLKLVIEIMRFREQERYVYSPAELAAYERMRQFAKTSVRTALRRPS